MEITEFLSEKPYVLLPTKTNPKVYLPLDSKDIVERAFKLYNPFSRKGKVLKNTAEFLCVHFPSLAKLVIPTVRGKDSIFLNFLKKQMDKEILTSVYIATAKDKVVLQLQHNNGILGYLKYPTSALGKKRLINEQNAIERLTQVRRVPGLILKKTYDETPFIVLENIEGSIGNVSSSEFHGVLESFKKDAVFKLFDHPRILALNKRLEKVGQGEISVYLQRVASSSKNDYHEVFEHGDFAPWNLIRTEKGIVPFDFEYFEENGLEYLDELKYHFQEQHLLNNKKGMALISSLASKTDIEEFDLVFRIFRIKEICVKAESLESITFEHSLLTLMNASKPLS